MSSEKPSYGRPFLETQPRIRPRPAQLTWLGDIHPEDAQSAQPLRFRLAELFCVITAAAALLALFRAIGIFGALFAFITALAFTNQLYPNWRSKQDQETMFDFIWGIVMPIVCLVFDPFVFKLDEDFFVRAESPFLTPNLTSAHFASFSAPAYTFILSQWLCIAFLLVIGRPSPRLAAFCAGFLSVGFLFAGLLGVLLFIPSVLGLFALGIGILGFTPLFTARAYYRRTIYASYLATDLGDLDAIRAFGFCVALIVPLIAFLVSRLIGIAA
jgi:hypothetical protein